jgi:hypothetical protein
MNYKKVKETPVCKNCSNPGNKRVAIITKLKGGAWVHIICQDRKDEIGNRCEGGVLKGSILRYDGDGSGIKKPQVSQPAS